MLKTVLLIGLMTEMALGWASAGPIHSHVHTESPIQGSLHRAGHAVDEAWESFHRAALGGTLASPAVQTKIEEALHEARLLLVKARDAADIEDQETVLALTARIEGIANQIQQDSERRKQ